MKYNHWSSNDDSIEGLQQDIEYLVCQSKHNEMRGVEIGKKYAESRNFEVMTVISQTPSNDPMAIYGVFNKQTGVMEADVRQLHAALRWMEALQKTVDGDLVLPGLDEVPQRVN